ncbi:hybrid sensor histidine kinase/response regulator [Paucibacter soli]|uniref:hybrid sensor histidine kinase/response regulator n=1 Tax=Paucibacter soli TaxID=3133433 RepID=UPI0030AA65C8
MTTPEPIEWSPDEEPAGHTPALLRASPEIQAIADQLPLGVLVIETSVARILHLNREAERLLVLRRAQVLGHAASQHLDPALAELCQPARWRQLEGARQAGREDLRLQTAFGLRWLQVQRSLVSWTGARRAVGLISLQDASAKRQLERALQESDTRFREVTDSVRECLFVTTPSWDRLHFSSPLLLDTLGLTPSELRKAPQLFEQRVHPDDRALYARRLQAQAEGQPSDMVLRILHPAKGLRWVRLRTRLQPHAHGQSLVYGILADVSDEQARQAELQRARDLAEAASQAKSAFMANMSHEMRTPMNGIMGMTQLLLGTPLQDEQRGYAQAAFRSAETLLRQINNVLDFAQAESGQLALALDACSPRLLAETLLAQHAPAARAKGLRLLLECGAGLPLEIQADALRLSQLLDKLLDNAIKFTARGEVRLKLEVDAEQLHFHVQDSGIGMAAEDLPRLFSAFTQGNASLARPHEGSGLGLSIAQGLVKLMGGRIHALSTPGVGSCITVSLPLEAPIEKELTDAHGAQRTSGLTPFSGRSILVVEDNETNQEVIREMLLQLGCRVRLCADALSGLQALCEEQFDLVMMDIHMPGMDGMEALSWFRKGPTQQFRFLCPPSTKVVAVTANALDGDELRLRQHGFDGYLPKPVRQSQLLDMLTLSIPDAASSPTDANADPSPLEGRTMTATPEPMSGAPALLDSQALARLRELDPDGRNQLLQRVVQAFLKSLERLLPELAQARAGATPDLAAVRHVAHTLKSSSASLGAMELSRRCADIEAMVRNNQSEGLDSLLDGMQDEVERVRHALSELLTGPQ